MQSERELIQRLSDCPICCDQLEEARECPHCHSLFCQGCLEPWLHSHSTCPSCRKSTQKDHCKENIPVQRFVDCLPVSCPFNINGCRSMPAKTDLHTHQSNCEFHPEKIKQQAKQRKKNLEQNSATTIKQIKAFQKSSKSRKSKPAQKQWIKHIDSALTIAKEFFAIAEYLDAVSLATLALQLAEESKNKEKEIYCLIKIGFWLTFQAQYTTALENLSKAQDLIVNSSVEEFTSKDKMNELLASCSKHTGFCLLKESKFDDARVALEQAKDLYLLNPPSGIIMAELLNSLGVLAKKQSRFGDAATLHKQSLKFLSQSDKLWTTVATNYADISRKLGELDEAETQYNKVIILLKEQYGSDNVPQCAQIYNSLGVIHKKKGSYKKALEFYQLSTKKTKQFFGSSEPHELIAINQANIGDVYRKLGDYKKAETSYFTAVQTLQTLYGPHHVEVAEVMHSQGLVCKKQGKYDEAERYYTCALSIIEKSFGTEHYKFGIFSNSLGDVERKRGKYEAAMILYADALKVLQNTLGASHIEVAEVLFNMGLVDHQLEHYSDALKKFKNARSVIVREFDSGHYKEGLVLNNSGLAHAMLQHFNEAYKDLTEAKKILIKQLGKDHIEVSDCLTSLGDVCMKLFVEDSTSGGPRLQEALKYYTEANRIVLKVFGPNHKKAEQLSSLLFICENYSSL